MSGAPESKIGDRVRDENGIEGTIVEIGIESFSVQLDHPKGVVVCRPKNAFVILSNVATV